MTHFVTVVACLLIAGAIPVVAADHPQPGQEGETITFDHRGGNEWWVEVKPKLVTNEPQNIHIDRVEARDDGGAWVQLSLRSWGNYAGSFHIEQGNRVQFRAAQHGGMSDARVWESCWFTHPAGVEQCGSVLPTFTPLGGDSYVGVRVTGVSGVSRVSYHIPSMGSGELQRTADPDVYTRQTPGGAPRSIVLQFMAETTSGARYASGCYQYPAKTAVACPSAYNAFVYEPWQPSAGTIAVDANGEPAPASVEVRFDGGPFKAMTRSQSGGHPWTLSGAPTSGDHVAEFRLKASDGRIRCDESGYHYPPDEEYSRIGVDGPIVFANAVGNSYWVQINTYSVPNVVAVDAKVNNGAWMPLKLRSHCDWAAGIQAPAGSQVTFRAFRPDLSVQTTTMAWPPGGGGGGSSGFDATFKNVRGNTYWIETDVTVTGGTLSGVDARVNSGAWVALEKKSWGSWAKSIYAPSGAKVDFRARATDGSADLSGVYTWPPS